METARNTTKCTSQNSLSILCMCFMILFLVSCNNEDTSPDFSTEDSETAGLDAMDDYYFDDADDIVTAAIKGEAETTSGRASSDHRLLNVSLQFSGTLLSGSLKIDFGSGCQDARGNLRKGIILVNRVGAWDEPGSYWTITFDGYSINGITIEGIRTVTVVSVSDSLTVHNVTLTKGRISWPDGRVATREVDRRREHERNENNLLDRLIIYGNAQGTLCNGRGYKIEITEPLVYDRRCVAEGVIIPVEGKKIIQHGNREVTVDYGDGACDNFVTLTNKTGMSVRYEVGK